MKYNLKKDYPNIIWTIFRLVIGMLFAFHGAQKLFGLFGGTAKAAFTQLWFAGIIEFFGGAFLVFGLLTRFTSVVSGLLMVAAYILSHASKGLNPLVNRGELAILYFLCFLLILVWGGGPYSLDALIFPKKKKH